MTYRAQRLNPEFVQALNMIEMEFSDKAEKPVRDAWKVLLDHFTDVGLKTPEQKQADSEKDLERASELTTKLLVLMGKALGYDFDEVTVKKGCYYPEALGNLELEQHQLRWAFLNLLSGGGIKLPIMLYEATQQTQQAPKPEQPPAKASRA